MNHRMIRATAIALAAVACSEQPPPAEEPQSASADAAAETPAATARPMVDEAFIYHMHAHAEHMDEMMFALADDDLEGARTPAYWLSQHHTAPQIPDAWQHHVTGMREAARVVETATDLDTAHAASERVAAHCQGCHALANINARQ